MKRTLILLALVIMASGAFAQFKKDKKAAIKALEKQELTQAKEAIDKTMSYPEAANDAEAWLYKGKIYMALGAKDQENINSALLNDAYDAFYKVNSLDGKYKLDVITNLNAIAGQFFNAGIKNYENKKFDEGISNFGKAIKINEDNKLVDTMAYYGTALCYEGKAAIDKSLINTAIEKYEYLTKLQMKNPRVYAVLANLYKESGKMDMAMNTILTATTLFPKDPDLMITEANIHFANNDYNKADGILSQLKQDNAKNIPVLYAIAVNYDVNKNNEKYSPDVKAKLFKAAEETYKEIVAIDPENTDATFNLGALYYNKGGDLINAANALPMNETEKYNAMLKDGNDNLAKAMPYLEKILEKDPNNDAAKASLREIYTRLNLKEKIGNLK